MTESQKLHSLLYSTLVSCALFVLVWLVNLITVIYNNLVLKFAFRKNSNSVLS